MTDTDRTAALPDVQGRCPACGGNSLMLADGGYITCRRLDCPRPDLVNELIGEIGDARNHAAYSFCSQNVGHVTMTAFAKKITEKVTAVAHRKEAVDYANEQKQRAEQVEELLHIAHETSNTSEAARARAVQRAEQAEAAIARVQALAEQWQAVMRPGEKHPAAQQIHAALDQPAPKETV